MISNAYKMIFTKGKLIVIEGGDGAGKATQASLLHKELSKHRSVSFFEFPRYKQARFGQLIRRCLSGEFGDFLELSPYLSSLPYILDRARAKYLLVEALKEGDVICDRYTASNIAHQSVKLPANQRKEFIKFIEEGEYEELGLPSPDLVVYLWVPPEIANKLVQARSLKERRNIDVHEKRKDYQASVIDMYLRLCESHKNWYVVNCIDKSGRLMNRQAIHKKILRIVRKHLKD